MYYYLFIFMCFQNPNNLIDKGGFMINLVPVIINIITIAASLIIMTRFIFIYMRVIWEFLTLPISTFLHK